MRPGDPDTTTTAWNLHLPWPSLRLHICRSEVAIYCIPTNEGIVLVILAILAPGQPQRWLPTYGTAAEDFAVPAYTIARDLVAH